MKQLDAEVHGVTPEDVERAAMELRAYLPPTPLQHSRAFTEKARCHVYLKIESIQPIRAFKVRGALNKLIRLTGERRSAGVITASAGNHGMGVAYAAAVFNAPATVYVPETANPFKVEAIRRLGARVVEAGRNYNGAYIWRRSARREKVEPPSFTPTTTPMWSPGRGPSRASCCQTSRTSTQSSYQSGEAA